MYISNHVIVNYFTSLISVHAKLENVNYNEFKKSRQKQILSTRLWTPTAVWSQRECWMKCCQMRKTFINLTNLENARLNMMLPTSHNRINAALAGEGRPEDQSQAAAHRAAKAVKLITTSPTDLRYRAEKINRAAQGMSLLTPSKFSDIRFWAFSEGMSLLTSSKFATIRIWAYNTFSRKYSLIQKPTSDQPIVGRPTLQQLSQE